jgi:protein transport protein SEC31
MVRFRDIPRTAAFAWSPDAAQPKIATGTKAGALDADFSSSTVLDLWDVTLGNANLSDELQPYASLPVDSRYLAIVLELSSDAPKIPLHSLELAKLWLVDWSHSRCS